MSTHISDHLDNALDMLELTATKGDPTLVPTGFDDLDLITAGGLRPGSLTVIASRPGMGRTTLMSDICRRNAIADGRPVAVWTLEETPRDFMTRLIGAEARVPLHRLREGSLDEDAWTRVARIVERVKNAPMYLSAPASLTADELAEEAARLVEEHRVRLIAVDGLQDIRPERRNDLREREVGDVARDLKALARRLQVPVVVTSHLNRGPEQRIDKRPRLDDLRESGAITFAADLLVLLHREDYYERETPRLGEADLIVAKNRHGQAVTVTVAYQGHYGRFVNMAPESKPAPRPNGPAFDFAEVFRAKKDGSS